MSDNWVSIQQETHGTTLVPENSEITNAPLRPDSSNATVDSMELTNPLPPPTAQDPWKGVLQIERLIYNAGLLYILSSHNNSTLNHSFIHTKRIRTNVVFASCVTHQLHPHLCLVTPMDPKSINQSIVTVNSSQFLSAHLLRVTLHSDEKQWGLKYLGTQDLLPGAYICLYIGELIDEQEKNFRVRRKEGGFMIKFGNNLHVDTYGYANLARFLTFSDEYNCTLMPVIFENEVNVAVVAAANISPGEFLRIPKSCKTPETITTPKKQHFKPNPPACQNVTPRQPTTETTELPPLTTNECLTDDDGADTQPMEDESPPSTLVTKSTCFINNCFLCTGILDPRNLKNFSDYTWTWADVLTVALYVMEYSTLADKPTYFHCALQIYPFIKYHWKYFRFKRDKEVPDTYKKSCSSVLSSNRKNNFQLDPQKRFCYRLHPENVNRCLRAALAKH